MENEEIPQQDVADPAIIDAISGEANDSTGVDTTMNTTDSETTSNDSEVVSTVVKEFVT